jgi:hypothetical protein
MTVRKELFNRKKNYNSIWNRNIFKIFKWFSNLWCIIKRIFKKNITKLKTISNISI